MAQVLDDPILSHKFEADLRQYYQADLRDLADDDSKMSVRWVIVMLDGLPMDSRVMQHILDYSFTTDQHLLANIYDVCMQVLYQTSISAASAVEEDTYKTLGEDRPKPMTRPGPKPIEEEIKVEELVFTSGKQLKAMLAGGTKVNIAHSKACIDSGVNKAGQLNCDCPPTTRKTI